jgi:Holliday junction resolvase RusA-like endonuclease
MSDTTITINMAAVGQPRHRSTRTGRHYVPKSHPIHDFKAAIRMHVPRGLRVSKQAFSLSIVCHFQRPKSHTKKQRLEAWHLQTPDSDNIAKAVMDALNKVVWHDDKQVCVVTVLKQWCEGCDRVAIKWKQL